MSYLESTIEYTRILYTSVQSVEWSNFSSGNNSKILFLAFLLLTTQATKNLPQEEISALLSLHTKVHDTFNLK